MALSIRVGLAAAPAGRCGLTLYIENGKPRITAYLSSQGVPTLAIFDEDGLKSSFEIKIHTHNLFFLFITRGGRKLEDLGMAGSS